MNKTEVNSGDRSADRRGASRVGDESHKKTAAPAQ
jgi:hypothetical protein